MEVRIATPEETEQISRLSRSLGNVPFFPEHSIVELLEHNKEIVGFAATQTAMHAAGSWVQEKFRRQKHSYTLRQCLDQELKRRGFPVYFALPNSNFEKALFAKYGLVTEHLVQVRHL